MSHHISGLNIGVGVPLSSTSISTAPLDFYMHSSYKTPSIEINNGPFFTDRYHGRFITGHESDAVFGNHMFGAVHWDSLCSNFVGHRCWLYDEARDDFTNLMTVPNSGHSIGV
ncbi:MAG: hypothetical protein ACKVVP_00210, partial [Chloroflexota bacterium]